VLFTDGGEVWTRGLKTQGLGFHGLKWTPGLGLRVFSPLGPIQVNVGYNPYSRVQGPLFYDAPIENGYAPLYCVPKVSDKNDVAAVTAVALPAHFQDVSVNNRPLGKHWVQETLPCPSNYKPPSKNGFLNRLTFTFSIGPDF